MILEKYGFDERIRSAFDSSENDSFQIGRIVAEHKERYTVVCELGEVEAEITGNMRFSAIGREDFPAVGDWVALTVYSVDFAIIHRILPRISVILRQAVGQRGDVQVIATNIDFAFIVLAVGADFNINRLERYLTLCYTSKVSPIVILTKIDLIEAEETQVLVANIKNRIENIEVYCISNLSNDGIEELRQIILPAKTYCMLGSSGVGKSTLINSLSGKEVMKTNEISESTNKGKHTTTHRELILLENGGIIIDNPGMKLVGLTDSNEGLNILYDKIVELSSKCKYDDCTHTNEDSCAVIEAVEDGIIDIDSYNNYLRLEKERSFFESSQLERRKKEKEFGRLMKNYKKDKKQGKY